MPRSTWLAALAVAALAATTGCQATGQPGQQAVAEQVAQEAPAVSVAKINVEPANGTAKVRPDQPVTIKVADGTLTDVNVVGSGGKAVPGELSADATEWRSKGILGFATSYSASVRAVDGKGLPAKSFTTFETIKPSKYLETAISPLNGSTVGVGMPIIVRFTTDVANRAAVERKLTVTSKPAVTGAWHWTSDSEVHWRPQQYWPAYTDVSLTVPLAGLDAGNGVWGKRNRTIKFSTGASMISVVNVDTLRMTVKRNGKVARTIPVTTGKAGFLTRNGIKVVMEKHKVKVMDAATLNISRNSSEYYRLDVPLAMRVTFSGEFVHAAPWSVGRQGRVNVSHGCVGMSMTNAQWLYSQSRVGDVIQVVGSPRHLEAGNGWTDWNVPWDEWVAGSASA